MEEEKLETIVEEESLEEEFIEAVGDGKEVVEETEEEVK